MAGTTPSASISVSPSTIASNQTATLSWSSANVQNCTINGETMLNGVSVGTSGSIQVSPSQTTSYVLECTGDNGSASAQAQLVVQAGGEIGISISPSTGTLASGASMQFVATVVNDASDQGVRWSASFGSAPSATAANSFTATYTAPTVTQNTNVQITATSVADPSVSSAVTITVTPSGSTPSGPPQAGITPDSATITPGVSQTLIATISGDGVTSQAFTWVLNPAQGVTDPGTLVQTAPNTAIYTSPNINSLVTVQIVATSVQFPNVSGYSTIESGPATTDTKH
jgi:archaellum component FlaF (FlaF/FlaG flagellin family)